MDIRQITPGFAVSPQILPSDVPRLKAEGFTTVICNRPDEEVSGDEASDAIRAACDAEGLSFHMVPVTHAGMTPDLIEQQRDAIDGAAGPVFAYCRSGTRSCHTWALVRAGEMPADEIIAAGAQGGYDLTPLRQAIGALAQRR